jgi:transposase
MTDSLAELTRRLVVGHKRDGRSIYDDKAKRELVLACREPGASMARIARECGVNANLLAGWVRQHERIVAEGRPPGGEIVEAPASAPASAFVPVCIEPAGQDVADAPVVSLQARLPNGIVLDLQGCELGQACSVIEALGKLRCFASTKG